LLGVIKLSVFHPNGHWWCLQAQQLKGLQKVNRDMKALVEDMAAKIREQNTTILRHKKQVRRLAVLVFPALSAAWNTNTRW
jgi:hypothetical protein